MPVGAAQAAHDVAGDGDGAVGDLLGRFDSWLVNGVAEDRRVFVDHQRRHGAAVVVVQIANQCAQGGLDVRRVLHEEADQAERRRPALLTNQESEVAAAGPGDTDRNQVAQADEGNHVVGVIEKTRTEAGLGQQFGRVDAVVAQHRRNRCRPANADDPLAKRSLSLHPSTPVLAIGGRYRAPGTREPLTCRELYIFCRK